jgi:hypothetical protein
VDAWKAWSFSRFLNVDKHLALLRAHAKPVEGLSDPWLHIFSIPPTRGLPESLPSPLFSLFIQINQRDREVCKARGRKTDRWRNKPDPWNKQGNPWKGTAPF